MIYPWQRDLWRQLLARPETLPHALLLHGRRGTGKRDFAFALAQALLCEQPAPEGEGCGDCPACRWFSQGSHPDFRLLDPESEDVAGDDEEGEAKPEKKGSRIINVADVRVLADFVSLSTHRGGRRVVLIHPAEAMNVQAANALLKTLEEPTPGTVFLLVTHQLQHLLPTIRSRCRKVAMPAPSRAQAAQWLAEQGVPQAVELLAQAGYAPLTARELADGDAQARRGAFLEEIAQPERLDPIGLAESLKSADLAEVIGWLQKWLYDLMSARLAGQVRYHPEEAQAVSALAQRVDMPRVLDFHKELQSARLAVGHPLNSQLVLEGLLFSLASLTGKR